MSKRSLLAATLLVLAGCGDSPELVVTDERDEEVVVPPELDEAAAASDVIVPPKTIRQELAQTQRVFVNFHGPRIDDCANYCSDASVNKSWAIGSHFGRSSIDFAPWGSGAQRNHVISTLRNAFSPYDVEIVTERPSSGPYQMLVISSSTTGPSHGVSPLDCDNSNPKDIAFVYKVGTTSAAWVGQAAAHELGHSFGLSHVTSGGDFMHWNASGGAFTRSSWDAARSGAKCYDGNTQDAPALLRAALGAHGRAQPPVCSTVRRAAGASRHATAAKVSQMLFPNGASAVVLVRDQDQNPDALAAGPLAGAKDAPILLTPSDSLATPTRDEIRRLNPSTVYIVGGPAAVSSSIASGLRNEGRNVVRIAGSTRWETGAKVARSVGASSGLAFVASGENAHLVDALAGSGVAAALGAPILLVGRDAIPGPTANVLSELNVDRTVVLGGPAAISDAVLAQLPDPVRLAGASRYDTARAIADWGRNNGVSADHVFVARGDLGPDALAGAAGGQILLLTPVDRLHAAARNFIDARSTSATLLGGTGALSADVEYAVCDAL